MTDDSSSTSDRTADPEESSTADRRIVEALAEHTIPLTTVDPLAEYGDLEPLSDLLSDTRIVGLGEATHGTREFFQLKHRLLRYLVSELDVSVFGLEANFSETLALDDYVVYGDGDPKDALENLYFWTWNVESVLEMIDWLREFNADRPVADRVRFFGIDAQYTEGAVDALVGYFEHVDAEFLSTVRTDLDRVADDGTATQQDDDLDTRFEAAERIVPTLRDRLHWNRERYVKARSESEWELARQHVRVIEQATEYKRALYDLDDGTLDEEIAMEECLRIRDQAMAENVDWILGYENPDCMVIWAHDAHVNRVAQTSRHTGATAMSVGSHLVARHGDDYYAMGFSFGHGSFQAISEVPDTQGDDSAYSLREQTVGSPPPDTIDSTLAALDHPLAIVDIASARNDALVADWLAEPQRHRSIGATYDPEFPDAYLTEYVYSAAFDGVCYVDETSRARPLDAAESR